MLGSYFYHSFPRRFKKPGRIASKKGLSILTSIAERGFLLTPEIIEWREPLTDGSFSRPFYNCQKRVCFTELKREELPKHATEFGVFSIEFEISELRKLGAVPVFYIPKDDRHEYLGNVGGALIARLLEIQELLKRLKELKTLCEGWDNKNELLQITKNNIVVSSIKCTVGSAENLIPFLTMGGQPPEILESTIKALSGYFYPTEDLKYNSLLHYYRQREWRINANIAKDGNPVDRDLTETEKDFLIGLNQGFFAKEIEFRTGVYRRVDQCKYFSKLSGKRVLEFANAVIVPQDSIRDAEIVLKERGFEVEVRPLPPF